MRIDSYLSPKCEVRDCSHGGKGVFARVTIEPMELVAIFSGPVVTTEELSRIPESDATYSLSIHEGFHLGVAKINGEMDDTVYFNHSCEPNVGIKGQIVLLARRRISPGEELCFDYDTTEITPPLHISNVSVVPRTAGGSSMARVGGIRNSSPEMQGGWLGISKNDCRNLFVRPLSESHELTDSEPHFAAPSIQPEI